MNIAQLRTFVTVVERGSFSDAARAMGISQPAVTMQIQALEADAGATLLDRRYRRIDLTEAGRTLLPYARRVLGEVEQAREDIAALQRRCHRSPQHRREHDARRLRDSASARRLPRRASGGPRHHHRSRTPPRSPMRSRPGAPTLA